MIQQPLKVYNESNAELEALLNDDLSQRTVQENTIIKGRVEKIEDKFITIDVKGKSSGMIDKSELSKEELDNLAVDGELEVYVERVENKVGDIVLSVEKARRAKSWKKIEDAFTDKEKVSGLVKNSVKGGFIVEIFGIFTFCPSSQLSDRPIKSPSEFINKPLEFYIIKIDNVRMNVISSRRAILEEVKNQNKDQVISKYKLNDIVEGNVKAITSYGLFVSIENLDCLLHSSEVSHLKISNLNEMFSVGDTVKVQIIDIDLETKRISLSIKAMLPDPFITIGEKYQVGSDYDVKITKLSDFGAFAEIDEGVVGLIHSSEMKHMQKNVNPKSIFKVGDVAKVRLKEVDTEKRKISFSYKDTQPNPMESFLSKYPVGTIADTKVVNKQDFGLFLNTGDNDIDIFVHYKQISFAETSKDLENYNKGDEVKVKIIDIKDDKINGSIRALKKDPFNFFDDKKVGDVLTVRVAEVLDNAIKVNVGEERFQTIIKKADIALDKADQRPNRFAPGDSLDAMIADLNLSQRKLKLSIKELEKQQEKEAVEKYGSATSGSSLADILGTALKKKEDK
ncbi:SSU ribosomal protein S1p [Candidatus Pelagibacter sp. IMCC9063]|uniref:S1 RNA-binding domain-containing protein n=1 Tax=Pelagibacter sp. (strain IMCC9063) TaxID=1002672 RepID=UPI0002046351|nr:S1 RNA-binding domain-containing protein [Candidatus Pelagibacter sp. IMCC9063]AEA81067.1 SSU ribosomal protein S1p [Candidatus Pelagibacter sp. IMCC9063]